MCTFSVNQKFGNYLFDVRFSFKGNLSCCARNTLYFFSAVICLCCSCVHAKYIEWIVRRAVKTRYSWVLDTAQRCGETHRERKKSQNKWDWKKWKISNIYVMAYEWACFSASPESVCHTSHAITYDEKLKLWNFAISQPFRSSLTLQCSFVRRKKKHGKWIKVFPHCRLCARCDGKIFFIW